MIHEIDEVLRKLLVRELPIRAGEIDVSFDQPKRDWSARVNQPTLNLYVFDVRENNKLRASKQWDTQVMPNGKAVMRRQPVRIDVSYLVTAWTTDPTDEHCLIAQALAAFLRQQDLPDELLPENLRSLRKPLQVEVAQSERTPNPAELWGVMDNEIKPSFVCTVTVPIDPYEPIVGPVVRTREIITQQMPGPAGTLPAAERQQSSAVPGGHFWTVGGWLRSPRPLKSPRLFLIEKGLEVIIEPDGRFVIGRLQQGSYTLEVYDEVRAAQRKTITVPSDQYDLEVE